MRHDRPAGYRKMGLFSVEEISEIMVRLKKDSVGYPETVSIIDLRQRLYKLQLEDGTDVKFPPMVDIKKKERKDQEKINQEYEEEKRKEKEVMAMMTKQDVKKMADSGMTVEQIAEEYAKYYPKMKTNMLKAKVTMLLSDKRPGKPSTKKAGRPKKNVPGKLAETNKPVAAGEQLSGSDLPPVKTDSEAPKVDSKNTKAIIVDDVLSICRLTGTGEGGRRAIAENYGISKEEAGEFIKKNKIQKLLTDEEMEAMRQSFINSHEDHPDEFDVESGRRICPDCIPAKCESCDGIPEECVSTQEESNIKESAEKTQNVVTKAIAECTEQIKQNILRQAVDEMMELVPNEKINHPAHYTAGSIEVIDYLQEKMTPEMFEGFCIGNALKYLSRYRYKGGVEDLKKAEWYLNKIITVKESA
jgi:hypothetical protein